MTYQHATRGRDQAIAKALGTFVQEVRAAEQNAEKQEPAEDEKREEGA